MLEKTHILDFSGLSCSSRLDPGSNFPAAGPRADANTDTAASSGGLGEASSGVCPSSRGLFAGSHDFAHERRGHQRGNWAATESSRCLPCSPPLCWTLCAVSLCWPRWPQPCPALSLEPFAHRPCCGCSFLRASLVCWVLSLTEHSRSEVSPWCEWDLGMQRHLSVWGWLAVTAAGSTFPAGTVSLSRPA